MIPTYYDMEKLVRMVYDQKLSASEENIEIGRSKVRDLNPPSERVLCGIQPSGAAAK